MKGTKMGGAIFAMMISLAISAIFVSAALISGSLTIGTTDVNAIGSITMDTPAATPSVYVGDPATYSFQADVPDALTSAKIVITISETSLAQSDITSIYIVYDGGTSTQILTTAPTGNVMTVEYSIGSVAQKANIVVTITIVYATIGQYTVAASMSGTAN